MNGPVVFTFLDLAGSFAFAISGAVAARNRGLDIFGIFALAFIVACGGGIVRDLCIGAVPPAGLSDWRYLAVCAVAAGIAIHGNGLVERLAQPVIVFDSIGLGLFAVTGAQKAMAFDHNAQVAVLLGVLTGVGGGIARDILLNRVPVILQREIYALPALVAAGIEVGGERAGWSSNWRTGLALSTCFALRYMALRLGWHLPRFGKEADAARTDGE